MTSHDRRRFLKLAAATAGASLAAGCQPAVIRKALAVPPVRRTGTIADVEHVVILMQENRSFDHYFGSLRGVRGFGDPRPAMLPDGRTVWQQPGPHGPVLPFRPQADRLGLQFVEDLPHGWNDTHDAWNHGRHDRWVRFKSATTMAHMCREDIPFHYALADAFTICDAYHCSLLGSTDPNRYYMWTGYVGNDGRGGGPVLDNAEKGYAWHTYPERLQQAGVRWKIYQDIGTGLDVAGHWGWTGDPYIGNYGDNSLLYFEPYRNARPGDPLYERARTGTHAAAGEGYFDILRRDVQAGTLPQVSWIVAPEAFSEHPNWPSNYGAWYVAQVIDILASNPGLWGRTALFLTYDENDGFFDHVPPPFAAMPARGRSTVDTQGEHYGGGNGFVGGPYGLGLRVPMLVISPWTAGGWVCSQTFDHTSILRFLERRFGVMEPNISPWRRAVCGDLTSAFDFAGNQAGMPRLPDTATYAPPDRLRHADFHPVPPDKAQLPTQEPGHRPARALPYALRVRGEAEPGGRGYRLDFLNEGTAGAALLVYAEGRAEGPDSYTVEPRRQLSDYWMPARDGRYALTVHGPNGFLRESRGRQPATTAAALPEVHELAASPADPDQLRLLLRNPGGRACRLVVRPNDYIAAPPRHYTLPPGSSVEDVWEIGASSHWYDLVVDMDGDHDFRRRLAGHRETGRPSRSDPALGRG